MRERLTRGPAERVSGWFDRDVPVVPDILCQPEAIPRPPPPSSGVAAGWSTMVGHTSGAVQLGYSTRGEEIPMADATRTGSSEAGAQTEPQALRTRAVPAAGRVGLHAGMGASLGHTHSGDLRRPRRRREGQRDQAGRRIPQCPGRPSRRAAGAERPGTRSVVFPALRQASAIRRRNRVDGPVLVQPRRRRAGDGLLHPGGVPPVPGPVPGVRAVGRRGRHPAAQVLVLGQRRRTGARSTPG